MIARTAQVMQVRCLKYQGHVISNAARVTVDGGLDEWIPLLTADEVAWAEGMLESGDRLTFTIDKAPS